MRTWSLAIALWMSLPFASAQRTEVDSLNRKRWVPVSMAAAEGIALTGLYFAWYDDYSASRFHFFNDNSEWLQMDKAGHFFSTYTVSRYGHDLLSWSGMNEKRSTWIGGINAWLFHSSFEVMDGFSSGWGFSWGDQIANTLGTSLFISQQLAWREQRIVCKFSYSNSAYAQYNEALLGRNFQQRLLKDYNAQTYWASMNIHSFLASDAAFPKWMNIAFGYGASGMINGEMNVSSVNNFQRTRSYYVSFDADLNRVKWPKRWMKITAKVISFIKVPGPTLEVRSDGTVKMHALFF